MPDQEDWIIRSLRAMHQDEPGYDPAEALARFHAAIERMETDPAYAEYIRRLADEADMDFAALDQADQVTIEVTSPEAPGEGQ